MNHFKVVMGFFMLATLVWLLNVLAGLTGHDGVTGTLTLLIAFGVAAYAIGQTLYTSARVKGMVLASLMVVGGSWLGMYELFDITQPYAGKLRDEQTARLEILAKNGNGGSSTIYEELEAMVTTPDEIAWVPYSPEVLAHFRAQNRLIFLDFTADWCLTCKANERLVIDTRKIRELFADRQVVTMIADYTDQDPEMTAFINSWERAGVPMYLVYPGERDGILLPETITKSMVIDAVESAAAQLEQRTSKE
jgi:thiol:disulfide interchange protein DsbD